MVSLPAHKWPARVAVVCVVSVVALLAVAWTAPRVSGAVATWLRTPPVRASSIVLAGGLPVQRVAATGAARAPATRKATTALDAGLRFTAIGLTCTPERSDDSVVVRLRTSLDRRAWSRWYSVPLEWGSDGTGPVRAFTEPIWTGPARYVEVSAEARTGSAPVELRDARLMAIDATGESSLADAVAGAVRRTVAVIAGVELAPPAAAMTSQPRIVTRAQWGANESLRSGSPSFADVHMAFVHHTDSGNTYTAADAPAVVRAVYYYHTKALHWSDVGYNFLIDRFGTVYEGRYGGVTKGTIGAQVLGFNTGSTGVSIIGTFQTAKPPAVAVTALERLLAWKLDVHHVDPQSTATITCNYGQKFKTGERVRFPAIAGHRDANYTDCPGNKLYALLPAIRKAVARIGTPKIYGLWASPAWISPDGDGSGDVATVKFTVSSAADWSVQIQDDAGKVLRTFSGQGTSASVSWGGADSGGHVQPDGIYKVLATAHTASGDARAAATSIHIDRTSPRLTSLIAAPETFSPNGDGHADTSTVRFTAGETCSSRVTILDAGGAVVRKLADWTSVPASGGSARWDGRVIEGAGLAQGKEGAYRFRVELRDPAGNTGSGTVPVTVDRTLASPAAAPGVFSPNGDGVRDTSTLSFTLSRKATVTMSITLSGRQVRRLPLGSLAPGRQTAAWDGKAGDGSAAVSGFYRFVVEASSALGRSEVSGPLTLDRTRPRLTVVPAVTVGAGKTASLSLEANDQYSSKVKVGASVTDATGAEVASLDIGWLARGKVTAVKWKPPAPGQYTVTWRAADQGGNTLAGALTTQITVR